MSIRRNLPRTNATRRTAIAAAKAKLDNPGPIGSVLTAATTARLGAIHGTYLPAMLLVSRREAEEQGATAAKNPFLQTLKLLCKHFVGVFNFGVERNKYPASHRPYYGIDTNNSNLPDLSREEEILTMAASIISGDPLRVSAGGALMANPSAAEVGAANTALIPLLTASSNAKDALDLAQEALERLNAEADKVIKKIWDEVETFFNEETAESRRANAREWGVVYVSDDQNQLISGKVTSTQGGAPLPGGTVKLVETGETAITDADGNYSIPTAHSGAANLEFVFAGYLTETIPVDVPEGGELIFNMTLNPAP